MREAATVWQEAFEAECLGEALFARLRDLQPDAARRERLEVLRRLEEATRELLRPELARVGASSDGEAAAAAQGEELASVAAAQPWEQLLASLEPGTARYAALYAELRPLVGPADAALVDALAAHQQALCAFAARELAGDPHAADAILTLPHVARAAT